MGRYHQRIVEWQSGHRKTRGISRDNTSTRGIMSSLPWHPMDHQTRNFRVTSFKKEKKKDTSTTLFHVLQWHKKTHDWCWSNFLSTSRPRAVISTVRTATVPSDTRFSNENLSSAFTSWSFIVLSTLDISANSTSSGGRRFQTLLFLQILLKSYELNITWVDSDSNCYTIKRIWLVCHHWCDRV